MKKVLEAIGALTLGSALVGGGMLYGGALGVLAATDRKIAEETLYGRVLAEVIDKRKAKKLQTSYAKVVEDRRPKKPYISYANLSKKIREANKKINEKLIDRGGVPLGEVLEELNEVEKKVNEKFKDRDTVSTDEIAEEVHKELGLDRTDKWPFFSMTEEEQR